MFITQFVKKVTHALCEITDSVILSGSIRYMDAYGDRKKKTHDIILIYALFLIVKVILSMIYIYSSNRLLSP